MDKALYSFFAALNGGDDSFVRWLECRSENECKAVIKQAIDASIKEVT